MYVPTCATLFPNPRNVFAYAFTALHNLDEIGEDALEAGSSFRRHSRQLES
jgi:hypothetical protein